MGKLYHDKSVLLARQELKGNIRVFCRVRPLLIEDGIITEENIITYPTTTEAFGRGIDLIQHGTL